jgi:hypothetical protein
MNSVETRREFPAGIPSSPGFHSGRPGSKSGRPAVSNMDWRGFWRHYLPAKVKP